VLDGIICPVCGEQCGATTGAHVAPAECPRCGTNIETSPPLPGPADEGLIVDWLSSAASQDGPEPIRGELACPTCGYEGPMDRDGERPVCPACRSELPILAGRRIVRCPGCGQAFGLSEEDRDRTILCPRCKRFLGCLVTGDRGRRGRR
jgi:uncharacterized paraquat-inducible protein A